MTTIKCDKCGKEINGNPLQQACFPSVNIYVKEAFVTRKIDLCNDCEKKLYEWLKGADDGTR